MTSDGQLTPPEPDMDPACSWPVRRIAYVIHRITDYLTDDEVRTSIAGHRELIDAVLARDPDKADLVARTNVLSGLGKTLARLL